MNYLLFGGGLYMVLMAVFWLIQPASGRLGLYFAAMYSSTGLIVLYAWAERTGFIYAAYPLYNIQIPLCYAFAPLLYYGFSQIAELHRRPASFRIAYFLPAMLALPAVVINNLINAPLFADLGASATPELIQAQPSFLAIHLLGLGSNIYILFFLFRILMAGAVLLRDKELKTFKELRLCLAFVVWFILDIMAMMAAHLLKQREILYAAKFSSSLTFIAYSFYSFRYPEYAQRVIRRSKEIRYRNTQLRGVNTDELLERLEYLMDKERLFSDMELTLVSLSERLMVTPHQLSEILNDRLGRSFRAYLNERRVKQAERLLIERPAATILEIAFEVGFNSKTSFNENFLKQTGLSPSDFRKRENGVRTMDRDEA